MEHGVYFFSPPDGLNGSCGIGILRGSCSPRSTTEILCIPPAIPVPVTTSQKELDTVFDLTNPLSRSSILDILQALPIISLADLQCGNAWTHTRHKPHPSPSVSIPTPALCFILLTYVYILSPRQLEIRQCQFQFHEGS